MSQIGLGVLLMSSMGIPDARHLAKSLAIALVLAEEALSKLLKSQLSLSCQNYPAVGFAKELTSSH
jgi:hypothetical protein